MIDRFTKQHLFSLAQKQNAPCVTIYLPTKKTGKEIYQPVPRLKKLIHTAQEKLTGHWMSETDAAKFLEPISELANDSDYWQHTDLGLGLFLNADSFQALRVDVAFSAQVFVSHHFFVRPMLMVIGHAQPFNILKLSQNKAQLLEAVGTTIEQVDVPGMPQNLNDALEFSQVDRGAQVHTGSREFGGKKAGVFHGQGVKSESAKDDLRKYFRLINTAVSKFMKDKHQPLVLACVAEHAPIYLDLNSHSGLLDEVATGNFDRRPDSELLEKSLPIVKKHFDRQRQTAINSYRERANTTRTLSETSAVIAAGHNGQIDKLLVSEHASLPGAFNVEDQTINYESSTNDCDLDLVEDAIAQTLLHHGEVYSLAEDEMPTDQPLVATLRY